MSELQWKDISNEAFRVYTFPGGEQIRIDKPLKLAINPPLTNRVGGGSHRVVAEGKDVYVTYGWLSIEWVGHNGESVYSF